jgi:2-methylisocitrate lyase-like PEP mutase family enzyme
MIKRLQAFLDAGADVLCAPGLPEIAAIRTICMAADKPINVVLGLQGQTYSVAQLSDAGLRRISFGGFFARAALGVLMRAAEELKTRGTFTYSADAIPDSQVSQYMPQGKHADRG